MAPSWRKDTRAIYALVTTFLFIMVVLFVVLGVMYLSARVKEKKAIVNNDLIWFDHVLDAKNRLLSKDCYGQVIQEIEANDTCPMISGVIIGYRIEMLPYENCTNVSKVWNHMYSNDEGQEYPYFVPIQSNATGNLCPGLLKVIR